MIIRIRYQKNKSKNFLNPFRKFFPICKKMSNISVVIMAAGEGSRMRSSLPKVLHLLHNKPMLLHILEQVILLSPKKIFLITGRHHTTIQQALSQDITERITFVNQPQSLGTGDAVKCVLPYLENNERVLILNGDVPLIRMKTLSLFLETGSNLLVTDLENSFGYGRIILQDGKCVGICEEKECSVEQKLIKTINTGIYCFSGKVLKDYIPLIRNNNSKGEYYLTDMIEMVSPVSVYFLQPENQYEILGVNTPEELEEVSKKIILSKDAK